MTRPRRLLISDEISDRVRQLHPDLKRKIRAAVDILTIGPRRTVYEEAERFAAQNRD